MVKAAAVVSHNTDDGHRQVAELRKEHVVLLTGIVSHQHDSIGIQTLGNHILHGDNAELDFSPGAHVLNTGSNGKIIRGIDLMAEGLPFVYNGDGASQLFLGRGSGPDIAKLRGYGPDVRPGFRCKGKSLVVTQCSGHCRRRYLCLRCNFFDGDHSSSCLFLFSSLSYTTKCVYGK